MSIYLILFLLLIFIVLIIVIWGIITKWKFTCKTKNEKYNKGNTNCFSSAKVEKGDRNISHTTLAIISGQLGIHHEKKVMSQQGEDGIIAEIFQRVGTINKYYVEFGAGHDYDNTRVLNRNGWKGLLLGDEGKDFTNDNRIIKKAWITYSNVISLFKKYQVPVRFDFLSIDTDFKDYWILESILNGGYKPKVICAEINRNCYPFVSLTVPKDSNQMQWLNSNDYFGATPQAFMDLVKQYGYDLVYCEKNAVNCFFILDSPKDMVTKLNRVFKCSHIHKNAGIKQWYNTRTGELVATRRIDGFHLSTGAIIGIIVGSVTFVIALVMYICMINIKH